MRLLLLSLETLWEYLIFLYEYLKNVVMFSEKHQHKIKKRQQIFR